LGATLALIATAPVIWRSEKTVSLTGHILHRQDPSPVSAGFVAPSMAGQLTFRPDALAASMARTLTLRPASDALLAHWARSQLAQIELLVRDGANFELTPDVAALADAERSGFAGRVGAGITDLLMNTLGYVWRDNAACLSSTLDPHADFIYAGGAVSGHGVVLAEAHGSFAQSVGQSRIAREARRKYLRQVRPHIERSCVHGKVIHGYSVAFGSNPSSPDTYLHVSETRISKPKGKPSPPSTQPGAGGPNPVSTSLALAAHRSNFLLMGATQIVAWIDWLRGADVRPTDDAVATFFTTQIAGHRFLVAAAQFFPYFEPWLVHEEASLFSRLVHWDEFDPRWFRRGFSNVFAMDEFAGKSFLGGLASMIAGGREQAPPVFELPVVEPIGLTLHPQRIDRGGDERYPVARFRDGLALLSRLPRSHAPEPLSWSADRGVF
jgi:hypothetical protein